MLSGLTWRGCTWRSAVDIMKQKVPEQWQGMPYFTQLEGLTGVPVINIHIWWARVCVYVCDCVCLCVCMCECAGVGQKGVCRASADKPALQFSARVLCW